MKKNEIKFDLDDILITPETITNINSRFNDIELDNIPLVVAPMDTVVDLNNYKNFLKRGMMVCLPRTINYVDFFTEFYFRKIENETFSYLPKTKYLSGKLFLSVGFDDLNLMFEDNTEPLKYLNNILIDIANGHMYKKIIDYCNKIKSINPQIKIMIGNIANPQTYMKYLKSYVVDYIRVGIGNGGGCLTTKNTGIGYPKASLIKEINELRKKYGDKQSPKIVADGGMKDYSDIIKSFALGADYVMLGSILNKALESSSKNYFMGISINDRTAKYLFKRGFKIKKYFRGMSTKESQKNMGKVKLKTSEGVVRFRNVEYTLDGWYNNLNHYLRSAMSYTNSKNINEFIGNVEINNITNNAFKRYDK